MRSYNGILLASSLVAILTALPIMAASPQKDGTTSIVFVDASKPPAPPKPLPFATGGRSPDGHVLSVNDRYLLLDGSPWLPVMGEFHFARFPAAEWEQEILKMKAGGVRIISTYIFWIHHEEIEGQFDWSGQRDLRRFVELCAKHGLYVWVRVGPWVHGECRNGGFPEWLIRSCPTRQNDPTYLSYVRRYYEEIGRQLHGLFWKDGGPIIGVQIENEYGARGAGKGSDHILELKHLAGEAGLDAPFYTVTGWDGVEVPSRDVLPVFGGYADSFWDPSVTELPPNTNYFFTHIRCQENVDSDLRSKRPDIDAQDASYPFLTAEMGGGMETSYNRRPLMRAEDTAAMVVAKLGSGVTLYGYYMFHGGTNPEGKQTTMEESRATGYPNDLPVKSYDYQAPLGEFGQMNSSFREVKAFNLFLHDFGASLAPMTSYFPGKMPASILDATTPRVAVRVEGDHGFVFLNNYQRSYPLPERKGLQVRLKMASQTVDVPRHPVDVPSGAYAIWPVNLDLGTAVLRYATVQLLCKLDKPKTYVFFAWPGVMPEFAFQETPGNLIEAPHARITRESGVVFVDHIVPSDQAAIRIRTKDDKSVQIVVLSHEQARNTWKAALGGEERLFLSPGDVFFERDRIDVQSSDTGLLTLGVFPTLGHKLPGLVSKDPEGIFELHTAPAERVDVTPEVRKLRDAERSEPANVGAGIALAPSDADFDRAARWLIRVPSINYGMASNAFLRITYVGDVARLYAGDKLITDDFYKGTPWEIGLQRISREDLDRGLELRILPLRPDAPIYLPLGARPALSVGSEVATLKDVQIVPEYEALFNLGR